MWESGWGCEESSLGLIMRTACSWCQQHQLGQAWGRLFSVVDDQLPRTLLKEMMDWRGHSLCVYLTAQFNQSLLGTHQLLPSQPLPPGQQGPLPSSATLPPSISYPLEPLTPFKTDKLSVPALPLSTLTSYLWDKIPIIFIILPSRVWPECSRLKGMWATESLKNS